MTEERVDEQTRELVKVEEEKQKILHAIKRVFQSEDGKLVLDHLIKSHCVVTRFIKDPAESAWFNSRHALIMDLVATVQGPDFFAPRIRALLTPTEQPNQPII